MTYRTNNGLDTGGGSVRIGGDAAIGPRARVAAAGGLTPSPAETPRAGDAPRPDADLARNVFVVHGRDAKVLAAMSDLLRRLDLRPLEWEHLVAATGHTAPFLGDVVAKALRTARVALVLLTPEDKVSLHPDLHDPDEAAEEVRTSLQPRPNVLIELGMVLAAYPERTVIVEFGRLRPIADLNGRNVVRFAGDAGSLGKIVERLKSAGCPVDDSGSAWRDLRPFAGLDAYARNAQS